MKRQGGYTLIEMAISITVFALIIAGGIGAYNLYMRNKVTQETEVNTATVLSYVNNFLVQQGRYPCPARADLPRTDPQYGRETNCADTTVAAVGDCTNGICVEESNRTDLGVPPPRVRRGMIPFRDMGLPENFASDGNRMRLQYALTEMLGVATTYRKDRGAITIIDGNGNPAIDPAAPHAAHFVIFSSGNDRAGTFTNFGRQTLPCPATGLDAENCNTTTDDKAVYRSAQHSTANGANHFDDYVLFYMSSETPLWRVSSADGAHIRDMVGGGAGSAAVGVGAVGSPTETLEVAGNVRASTNLQSDQICDKNGNNCFPASLIGAQNADMKCPPGKYAVGIGSKKLTCTDVADIRCPPGHVVSGVNADGTFVCHPFVAPPMCPPLTITECGNTHTWPAAPVDTRIDTLDTLDFSNNYGRRGFGKYCWRNPDTDVLEWTQLYETGQCNCVPMAGVECGHGCQEQGTWNGVAYWQGWWTGEACFQWGNTCVEGGEVPWLPVSNTCQCAPQTNTSTEPCPNGIPGQITWERNYTCGSDLTQLGTWTDWEQTSNTCACAPSTATQEVDCPVGSGTPGEKWTQTRNLTCPAATWSAWAPSSPPAGACQGCNPIVQTQTAGCPQNYVGSFQQTRSKICPVPSSGPEYTDWAPVAPPSGACSPGVYRWKPRTSYAGPFSSNPGGPFKDSICCSGGVCATPQGSTTTCVIPTSGQFMTATCICE